MNFITSYYSPVWTAHFEYFMRVISFPPCCEGGYEKLVDFQVIKNGQILINLFSNIEVLPFLSNCTLNHRK